MNQQAIFGPFLAMMALTFVVWTYMYVRRLHFFAANRIDPQSFATRARAAGAGPEQIQNPANNLSNLLELPLLFYGLCLYLYVTGRVDDVHVVCAWLFVALRVVHSLIHCTVNRVLWRFSAYAAAAAALWTMLIRSLIAAI